MRELDLGIMLETMREDLGRPPTDAEVAETMEAMRAIGLNPATVASAAMVGSSGRSWWARCRVLGERGNSTGGAGRGGGQLVQGAGGDFAQSVLELATNPARHTGRHREEDESMSTERWTMEIRCPQCGKQAETEAMQADGASFLRDSRTYIGVHVPGFSVDNSSILKTTVRCVDCRIVAWEMGTEFLRRPPADASTHAPPLGTGGRVGPIPRIPILERGAVKQPSPPMRWRGMAW